MEEWRFQQFVQLVLEFWSRGNGVSDSGVSNRPVHSPVGEDAHATHHQALSVLQRLADSNKVVLRLRLAQKVDADTSCHTHRAPPLQSADDAPGDQVGECEEDGARHRPAGPQVVLLDPEAEPRGPEPQVLHRKVVVDGGDLDALDEREHLLSGDPWGGAFVPFFALPGLGSAARPSGATGASPPRAHRRRSRRAPEEGCDALGRRPPHPRPW
mmetsp:Transcript_6954/g.17053  ORF Transcript_6954/g.17053 Transcript_6954/m.17053 type:complete len:213 (-) Transcript_6954:154-792(-)